jgi:hypothetical protein
MGYWKNRQIEEDQQGWQYRDGENVCHRCITDPFLKDLIKVKASQHSQHQCSFCGWMSSKRPNSMSFNDFMEVYTGAVFQYYTHAEEEAIAWDSEDRCYIGHTYDTGELVRDIIGEPSESEAVLDAIIDSLGMHTWCERNPYALDERERYEYSWEEFCKTVKHDTILL